MAKNYHFDRAFATLTNTTPVTALGPPPEGVSYRIFYINGINSAGAARYLSAQVNSTASGLYRCFTALASNLSVYVKQYSTSNYAEYPTIAVLDDTDETLEVFASGASTNLITVHYEIVDNDGERTFRNGMATLTGTTYVKLISAPTAETVHRVLNVNGRNTAGAARIMYLRLSTSNYFVGELYAANNFLFRSFLLNQESPFPSIILGRDVDDLYVASSGAATDNIMASYEVLDRRVL